ncbi:hypothetical protein LR48_Vigan07g001400 [Vigna angularis]|uniref:Uncharacterized protein n=1 Tax=Phaseolus angularis TaxID=3914 RepID=A0A0L9UTV1_PHAAN|nr:hypothetical protein LR48_Vigan07g001400 [Vigna angularis]
MTSGHHPWQPPLLILKTTITHLIAFLQSKTSSRTVRRPVSSKGVPNFSVCRSVMSQVQLYDNVSPNSVRPVVIFSVMFSLIQCCRGVSLEARAGEQFILRMTFVLWVYRVFSVKN